MLSTLTRLRAPSQSHHLSVHAPPTSSTDYSLELAALAARILFKSPLPSQHDLPVYILDSAAFPDARTVSFDTLLPYVLARLPSEEQLAGGQGYEIVFFAGGDPALEEDRSNDKKKKHRKRNSVNEKDASAPDGDEDGDISAKPKKNNKKSRPGWSWFLQVHSSLNRMMRKRLMHLYVIHEKGWVRVVLEMFATVRPKVRKKVVHVNSLTALALHIPIEDLLIPPSAYLYDRRKSPDIFAPYASGKRAFGVRNSFPISTEGRPRLPRVLREATAFLMTDSLLDVEGIFRVSAKAQSVEILKEAYDRGQKFVVWKDRGSALTFPQFKSGAGSVTVDDLDEIEGYGVHVASALIKLWYHELREPIFPTSSYQALEKYHGEAKATSPDQLQQLLSPAIVYSPLSEPAGRILRNHLLPLLSRVAEHSKNNLMTANNLAVCFAPNMVCGPDPIQDMKIVAIIQRLLADMITHWKSELAPRLGQSEEMFEESLMLPKAVADREDPLEEVRRQNTGESSASRPALINGVEQVSGIALVDNEHDDEDSSSDDDDDVDDGDVVGENSGGGSGGQSRSSNNDDSNRPTLPPRRSETQGSTLSIEDGGTAATRPVRRKPAPGSQTELPQSALVSAMSTTSVSGESVTEGGVRRKPAPAVALLPRYSTIVTNRPAVLAALRRYNLTSGHEASSIAASDTIQVDTSQHAEDLPPYEQSNSAHEGSPSLSTSDPASGGPTEQERSPEKIQRKPVGDGEGKDGGA